MTDGPDTRKGFIRARPVRVAYLVEECEHSHAMLDAVFAECHARWGGRFSLVVPCRGGDPFPAYLPWLEAYDPDVLYAYASLDEGAAARLREQFGPAFLLKHEPHDSGERDARYFRPELPFAMLSSLSAAVQYARAFPASAPQPTVIPDYLPGQASDRFIDDNFGTPFSSFHRWPLPENLADVVRPITLGSPEGREQFFRGRTTPTDIVPDTPALLREMAARRNSYGLAQLAADSAPRLEVPGMRGESFLLVIGEGFADRILFWNERTLMPSHLGRGFAALIVPASRLEDSAFFSAVSVFLNTRNSVHGANRNPWVKIVSASIERARLEELSERFRAADRWNSYHVADPVALEGAVPALRELQEARGFIFLRGFDREPSWKEFPVPAASIRPPVPLPFHLQGAQAPPSATQGLWALDIDIERQNNLSRYSNVTHRWRLPLRLRMHGAFRPPWSAGTMGAGIRYARSSREGFLVVYAGTGEEPPELTIPDDETAFRYALERGHDWPPLSHRGNVPVPAGPYGWARPSDKGRYLTGTLRLFGGLQVAGAYLLHAYWKSAFEELGGATGSARHDEIKRTLRRRLRDGRIEGEDAWDRIARVVAREAHRVRIPLRKLSFDELRSRHKPFLEGERQKFAGQEGPALEERIASAGRSLSHSVQALCARAVLYQGYEWRCNTCFHVNWNPVGNLRAVPSCEVCGESQLAPVDQAWDFRLNGFIREALKEHGVLALIWCLIQMEARVRDSFFFLGPHELYDEYPREPRTASYNEADLLCVVDRRVHVCEVKSSDRDIDLESLISVAQRVRPDIVTLAVMEAPSPRLSAKFAELERALAGSGVAPELLTLASDAFESDAFLPS